MRLDDIAVDASAIEDGQWVGNLPEFPKEVQLRVRGFACRPYRQLQAKLMRGVSTKDRLGDPNVELSDEMTNELLVKTILLDWRGLESSEGVPLPYSQEKAAEIIGNPRFMRFRDAVMFAASVVGATQAAQIEADTKN